MADHLRSGVTSGHPLADLYELPGQPQLEPDRNVLWHAAGGSCPHPLDGLEFHNARFIELRRRELRDAALTDLPQRITGSRR